MPTRGSSVARAEDCSGTYETLTPRYLSDEMTASLSQMLAAVGFAHLMFPLVWSRALTQASVTGPSKSLDPDSGTICGFTASVRHDNRPVQETAEDSFI